MFILLLLLIILAVLTAVLYNRLVRDRNRVDAAWSDIDVQLQRRHDLIPQLVKAIKHYAAYEKATLEAVTELRGAAARTKDVEARGELEEQLDKGVSKLLLLAENYPDLKASTNFLQLQKDLTETENYLQFARRYYNGAVRALNTRIESVPHNIIAGTFGFTQREFFQKSSDDVANVPLVNLGTVE
ncbi:MAG: LemA family protein [Woeseia sp.]|nr:LemA family protein [Woeseia sp.]